MKKIKKLYKNIAIVLSIICLFATVTGCVNDNNQPSTEPDNTETVTSKWANTVDFIVEAKDDEFTVLQITDTQIIDGGQANDTGNPLTNPTHYVNQTMDRVDILCFDTVDYAIETSEPDLIILTGDLIYGQFDHLGIAWPEFVSFMDSYKIPWAPIFGNHEIESKKGVDWQCEQLENAEYCLFKQRELTGNGNYTVGVVDSNDVLVRVFYMTDTNGNYNASVQSLENGHCKKSDGWGEDQFEWFETDVANIKELAPNVKFSLAIHIPILAFNEALLSPYGYEGEDKKIDIDSFVGKKDGDFGYIQTCKKDYYWDKDYKLWNFLKANGFDSVYCGHLHSNSASIMFENIRLTFGLKSGLYDSTLWKKSDGTLLNSNTDIGDPIVGGTKFVFDKNGSMKEAKHIYYHGLDGMEIAK